MPSFAWAVPFRTGEAVSNMLWEVPTGVVSERRMRRQDGIVRIYGRVVAHQVRMGRGGPSGPPLIGCPAAKYAQMP